MNQNEIKNILVKSLRNLYKNQPNLHKFTNETHQSEWNLVHHLANEISQHLRYLDYDVDPIKPSIKNRRPDIIFHERQSHRNNFLVVEVKWDKNKLMVESEKQKIIDNWFIPPLCYKFGAVINIKKSANLCTVEVLKNPI